MTKEITLEKAKETLKSLVSINSISRNESKLAEFLKKKLSALGFDARIDRHGNVIASYQFSPDGVCIALNSHMDTVDIGDAWTEEPFGCRMEGDVMYGLGSLDCKASMSGMLLALENIMEYRSGLKGKLIFTAVVQEEVQGEQNKGTVKMIRDGFQADMAIIGEPTGLTICRGCEGMVEVTVQTHGVPTHASCAEKGVNAINAMIKIIQAVNEKIKPGQSEILGSGAINVGVISGGTRSSVVPDFCECKIGRFVVEGESGEGFCKEIQTIIRELQRNDQTLDATAECTYSSFAGVVPEETPLVSNFKEATKAVMGEQAPVTGMRAHLDSDFLINMKRIPCVAFGPGDMNFAHMADEHIDVNGVVTAAKVYVEAIQRALK